MCRWLRRHRKPEAVDRRLDEAARKVADLHERADRVMPELLHRARRNHWGEALDEIFQGRRP